MEQQILCENKLTLQQPFIHQNISSFSVFRYLLVGLLL